MDNKRIAIITARGGSKRIPGKNIKEFCGKPIIAYSIEAAIKSGMFEEVMVSTDSEEIAEVAKHYGASVPFMRSKETSDDYATTNDVLKEVITEYKKLGRWFDIVACIYPTAPFITDKKLSEAIKIRDEEDADEVMTVVRFSFPPQRGMIVKDNQLEYQYPAYEKTRSQDLEAVYHDCGQLYIYKSECIMTDARRKIVPYVMPETEVQDIDNEEDWKLAELKYEFATLCS